MALAVRRCSRCSQGTTSWEAVGDQEYWCEACVGEGADLAHFLAACKEQGLCITQTAPGQYAIDKAIAKRKGLLVALGRLKGELRAVLKAGITAKYGPLMAWSTCLTCDIDVYVDAQNLDGGLLRHRNPKTQAWCLQNVPF